MSKRRRKEERRMILGEEDWSGWHRRLDASKEVKGPYSQTDSRWQDVLMWHPRLDHLAGMLARHIINHVRKGGGDKTRIKESLAEFRREVLRTIDKPRVWLSNPMSYGSFGLSGCWLCSFSNVLWSLGVKIRDQQPSPLVVLSELQNQLLLTPFGYNTVGIDPAHLITDGEVYLRASECFGKGGVHPTKSKILMKELKRGRCVIVNVTSHEHLTAAWGTHYVCLTKKVRGPDWKMEDPSSLKHRRFLKTYRRTFHVFLYEKRRRERRSR